MVQVEEDLQRSPPLSSPNSNSAGQGPLERLERSCARQNVRETQGDALPALCIVPGYSTSAQKIKYNRFEVRCVALSPLYICDAG